MSHDLDHIVKLGQENPLFALSYPQATLTAKISDVAKKAYK